MTTTNTQKGVLVDITRCIGCRGCQVACKSWNLKGVKPTIAYGDFTNPPKLNSECYTRIKFLEEDTERGPVWTFVKNQCMHCKDPACASVCPVGAFTKTATGAVKYHYDKCIGCRYCMIGCPFNIPKYEWEKSLFPWVRKCTFCSDRQSADMTPACIKVCPTEVMYYGDLDAVTAEARRRLQKHPGRYVNHIYGEKEAGGTNWIYISDVPFAEMGFDTAIPPVRLPSLTWDMLKTIPAKVAGLVTALSLIAYFRNRGDGPGSSQGKEK